MQQLALECKPNKFAASQYPALPHGDLVLPAHNPGQNPERVGHLNIITAPCLLIFFSFFLLFFWLPDVLIVAVSSLLYKETELCKVIKHYTYMFTCFC